MTIGRIKVRTGAARALLRLGMLGAILVLAFAIPLRAQTTAPDPKDLSSLAEILNKPEIRAWLSERSQGVEPAAVASSPAGDAGAAGSMNAMGAMTSLSGEGMTTGVARLRSFAGMLRAAVPSVPDEMRRIGGIFAGELRGWQPVEVALLLAVFVASGFGLEYAAWVASAQARRRMIALPRPVGFRNRMETAGKRLAYGAGVLTAFGLGSIGAFLLFDWPPVLGRFVLMVLQIVLIVRLVVILGRFLLAPGAERFRLMPMATASARFWFVWLAILVGSFFSIQFGLHFLATLGMAPAVLGVVGIGCGTVLLALALYVAWRHPDRRTGEVPERLHHLGPWALSAYLVGIWAMLFTGSITLFYLGVTFLFLPILMTSAKLTVENILSVDTPEAVVVKPSIAAVAFERGVRAVILAGSLYLVDRIVGLNLVSMDTSSNAFAWLIHAVLDVAVVVLLADFVWHLAEAWIDGRIAEADASGRGEGHAAAQNRWRTLLPVLKNILLFVLILVGLLTVLASLGVQIAPLVASAGVVGIAVGFGAQTLVKDVISGMFFLLDDAFRVGEYIESGSIKGTVEAFSLRSMKLRHHRGALHTIPFGSLDKITNYSRDWVIDKIQIGVTYDTDLNTVKKLVKQIGKELEAHPEYAPHILEPLKMQGVEQFGDYAIQIRMKMMTRPGEQFVIRRAAYALIKTRFAENGIRFATPTVNVSGRDADAGVAHQSLELMRPPVALAAGDDR